MKDIAKAWTKNNKYFLTIYEPDEIKAIYSIEFETEKERRAWLYYNIPTVSLKESEVV